MFVAAQGRENKTSTLRDECRSVLKIMAVLNFENRKEKWQRC